MAGDLGFSEPAERRLCDLVFDPARGALGEEGFEPAVGRRLPLRVAQCEHQSREPHGVIDVEAAVALRADTARQRQGAVEVAGGERGGERVFELGAVFRHGRAIGVGTSSPGPGSAERRLAIAIGADSSPSRSAASISAAGGGLPVPTHPHERQPGLLAPPVSRARRVCDFSQGMRDFWMMRLAPIKGDLPMAGSTGLRAALPPDDSGRDVFERFPTRLISRFVTA